MQTYAHGDEPSDRLTYMPHDTAVHILTFLDIFDILHYRSLSAHVNTLAISALKRIETVSCDIPVVRTLLFVSENCRNLRNLIMWTNQYDSIQEVRHHKHTCRNDADRSDQNYLLTSFWACLRTRLVKPKICYGYILLINVLCSLEVKVILTKYTLLYGMDQSGWARKFQQKIVCLLMNIANVKNSHFCRMIAWKTPQTNFETIKQQKHWREKSWTQNFSTNQAIFSSKIQFCDWGCMIAGWKS